MTNEEFREIVGQLVEACADDIDIHLEGGGPYSAAFNAVIEKAEELYPS